MSYRLYDDAIYKMIGEPTNEEKDILSRMGQLYSESLDYRFLIIKRENGGDFPYKRIQNIDDYAEYLKEYNIKQELSIENETVMQLKRDIIDKSNVKIKKFTKK